ncbi:MAG: GNAT family N-acetyltransferase [Mycobacteriales bacterium]
MTVRPWSSDDLRRNIDAAVEIYCAAMSYPAETGRQRKGYILVHTSRTGFRAMGAYDDAGEIVGFAYGYRGAPGQWWHDEVRRDLDSTLADRWLHDSFELCELHVRPDEQGHGIGAALLLRLLENCPHETVVLSTPEGESRAWRLYRRLGFVDVQRRHRFAGDDREFAVLGRALPIEAPAEPGG